MIKLDRVLALLVLQLTLCDSVDLSDLVRALPHDPDVAEAPRQRALRLHLLEVYPLAQALKRDGDEEQQQVTAEVEVAAFVVSAAGL